MTDYGINMEKESMNITDRFEALQSVLSKYKPSETVIKENEEFMRIAWDMQNEIEEKNWPRDNVTWLQHQLMGNDRYAHLSQQRPALFLTALKGKLKSEGEGDISKILKGYFDGNGDANAIQSNIESFFKEKVIEGANKADEINTKELENEEIEKISTQTPQDREKYFTEIFEKVNEEIERGDQYVKDQESSDEEFDIRIR